MPKHIIVFDCEHLTDLGVPQRFWCGPNDPDPLLAQIGAVRLSLDAPYALGDTLDVLVQPVGRHGPAPLPEFFTKFSGITADRLAQDGASLTDALDRFAAFCGDDPIYSWGKDEITSLAPSCFVSGITCPIPIAQFANAAGLVVKAGEPLDVVHTLRSNTIADHFDIGSEGRGHDGLDDAVNVARVLQHLLQDGRLTATDFDLA